MNTVTDTPDTFQYLPMWYVQPTTAPGMWFPTTATISTSTPEKLFVVELFRNEDFATYCAVWAYDKEDALETARAEHEISSLLSLSPIFESSLSIPAELEFHDGVSSTWRVRVY